MVETQSREQGATVLPANVNQKLLELYDIYRNKLKPTVFAVECNIGKFPVQILLEIRSYQDHIANCFLNDKTETERLTELNRANSHLQRAIADCYKTLLQIYYPDRIAKFRKDYLHVNLGLVSNGQFLPEFTKLEKIAKDRTLSAKKNEFDKNGEISCTDFEDAVLAYDDVISHIDNHSQGLAFVAQHTKRNIWRDWKFALINAIIGAALSTGVHFIIQNWDAIKNLFI
jgi:hypothetical protein